MSVKYWFRLMRAADFERSRVVSDLTLSLWFRGDALHRDHGRPFMGPVRFDSFLDLQQFVYAVIEHGVDMPWEDFVEAALYAEERIRLMMRIAARDVLQ